MIYIKQTCEPLFQTVFHLNPSQIYGFINNLKRPYIPKPDFELKISEFDPSVALKKEVMNLMQTYFNDIYLKQTFEPFLKRPNFENFD